MSRPTYHCGAEAIRAAADAMEAPESGTRLPRSTWRLVCEPRHYLHRQSAWLSQIRPLEAGACPRNVADNQDMNDPRNIRQFTGAGTRAPDSREFLIRERELREKLEALEGPYWAAYDDYMRYTSYSFQRPDGTLISGEDLVREARAGDEGAA